MGDVRLIIFDRLAFCIVSGIRVREKNSSEVGSLCNTAVTLDMSVNGLNIPVLRAFSQNLALLL